MNAPRKILGYGWAVLATPMVLALFFGYGTWPKLLAHSTGLRVSAWMNGGEVARTIPHEGYETSHDSHPRPGAAHRLGATLRRRRADRSPGLRRAYAPFLEMLA